LLLHRDQKTIAPLNRFITKSQHQKTTDTLVTISPKNYTVKKSQHQKTNHQKIEKIEKTSGYTDGDSDPIDTNQTTPFGTHPQARAAPRFEPCHYPD